MATNNIFEILSRPKLERLQRLTTFLETACLKELFDSLPIILDNIFGYDNSGNPSDFNAGWGLATLNLNTSSELSDSVWRMLRAEGSLLQAIHLKFFSTETNNTSASSGLTHSRYEFPIQRLSLHTQAILREPTIDSFFASKLVLQSNGQIAPFLSLNAFELYFFQFFSFVTHPQWKQHIRWQGRVDNLYNQLALDYLGYYLLLQERSAALLGNGKMSLHHLGSICRASNSSGAGSYFQPFDHMHSNLQQKTHNYASMSAGLLLQQRFRQDVDVLGRSTVSTGVNAHNEIWFTETVLQVAFEFWITWCNLTRMNSLSPQKITVSPSVDQICLARIFVKHVHHLAFVPSLPCRADFINIASFLSQLDEWRRVQLPKILSRQLTPCLAYCFEHWPYDTTFRVVLELWLTSVQPWRYVDSAMHSINSKSSNASSVGVAASIDEKWLPLFINENIHLYSIFWRRFMQRVARLDLKVGRNAGMLFRAAKVLCHQNLPKLLQQAEERMGGHSLINDFYTNAGATFDGGRSGFADEEENECAIFTLSARLEAENLVNLCAATLVDLRNRPINDLANEVSAGRGWWHYLQTLFAGDDNSVDMEQRDLDPCSYLEQSVALICGLYGLLEPNLEQLAAQHSPISPSSLTSGSIFGMSFAQGIPDCIETCRGTELTPLGRYQIANGLARFRLDYEGDPEMQPVRSHEIVLLVRLTNDLSQWLTAQLAPQLKRWCNRCDILGCIARRIFIDQPAVPVVNDGVFSPISTRRRWKSKEPRFRLRWLASMRIQALLFLAYFVMRSVVSNLFSSVPLFVLFLAFCFFLYQLITVFFHKDFDDVPANYCTPPQLAESSSPSLKKT